MFYLFWSYFQTRRICPILASLCIPRVLMRFCGMECIRNILTDRSGNKAFLSCCLSAKSVKFFCKLFPIFRNCMSKWKNTDESDILKISW